MMCQNCNINPATVFLKKVVNGKMQELHLCAACAKKLEADISLDDLFQGFINTFLGYSKLPVATQHSNCAFNDIVCDKCSMSYSKFKNVGKLGCDRCYEVFSNELINLFRSIQQGGTRHVGKIPRRISDGISKENMINSLRQELNKAVSLEQYEEAARLRDEIKKLKEQS
jgi:protein arginine kinase activator